MDLIEAKNKLDAKDKVGYLSHFMERSLCNFTSFAQCNFGLVLFQQELSFLQISSEGKVKVLETDLETARTTFRVLQERNKDLGEE